jgi:predicted acyl esterase
VGGSSPGGTQLAVATGPDRAKLRSLKALEVLAPAASLYEVYNHDGVPNVLGAPGSLLTYFASLTNPTDRLDRVTERIGCQPQQLLEADSVSGSYAPFWAARDHLVHMERLQAATLMVHGHADRRVSPSMQVGLFDAIPASTPKTGLFGIWGHQAPDQLGSAARADWERADYQAMRLAWFERYLRGVHNGADDWPTAQVQRTDGQWRTASNWPFVPGPTGSLALGPGGGLGVPTPTGTTTYLEAPAPEIEASGLPTDVPGTTAVFTTAPLTKAVEVIGRPSVDLWVQLFLPDSHLTARLEVVDAAGQRLIPEARTAGARSAQHLLPLVRGRMRQTAGIPAPVLEPFLVTIPLDPTDLIAPPGSRLRLTIAGSSIMWDGLDGLAPGLGAVFQGPTLPSGVIQPVTILHDAAHPSAVHFTTPEASSTLLDVRERDEGAMPVAGASGAGAPATTAPAPTTTTAVHGRRLPATGGSSASAIVVMALALAVGVLRLRHRPA